MVQNKRHQQRPQQPGRRRALRRPRCGRIRIPVRRRLLCLLAACCAVGGEAIYAESDPAAEVPEYCTLFHHQVKSAGSTIKDKLEMSSIEAGLPKPGLCTAGQGHEQSCLEAINGSHPVIEGYVEMLRDRLEGGGRNCEYFTVMRHPIDRLVSAFFYCPDSDKQLRPRKWCGGLQPDSNTTAVETQSRLLEFAKYGWKNKAYRQMTFRTFCPHGAFCSKMEGETPPPEDVSEEGTLDLLKQVETTLGTYTAVGILEHWNLTMDLFNARVKSPVRDWKATPEHLAHLGVHRSNAGVSSALRDQVSRWAHLSPEIHGTLATDMLLYDFAVSVFMQQTADTLGTEWG